MLHIQSSNKRMVHEGIQKVHPMEVLDASLRGELVETLLDK
jgi:hypothetical protein